MPSLRPVATAPETQPSTFTITRLYAARPEELWDLWTTVAGIEAWWGPEGFATRVLRLQLRPRGKLVYEMTAVGPEEVAFMKRAGLPLTTRAEAAITEVVTRRQLTTVTQVDFVPGVRAYPTSTRLLLEKQARGTRLTVTIDRMHDADWTVRARAGHLSQLRKLTQVLQRRRRAAASTSTR